MKAIGKRGRSSLPPKMTLQQIPKMLFKESAICIFPKGIRLRRAYV